MGDVLTMPRVRIDERVVPDTAELIRAEVARVLAELPREAAAALPPVVIELARDDDEVPFPRACAVVMAEHNGTLWLWARQDLAGAALADDSAALIAKAASILASREQA